MLDKYIIDFLVHILLKGLEVLEKIVAKIAKPFFILFVIVVLYRYYIYLKTGQ